MASAHRLSQLARANLIAGLFSCVCAVAAFVWFGNSEERNTKFIKRQISQEEARLSLIEQLDDLEVLKELAAGHVNDFSTGYILGLGEPSTLKPVLVFVLVFFSILNFYTAYEIYKARGSVSKHGDPGS